MKKYIVFTKGQGSITINSYELQPAMYIYSLLIDDMKVDTKRMILNRLKIC